MRLAPAHNVPLLVVGPVDCPDCDTTGWSCGNRQHANHEPPCGRCETCGGQGSLYYVRRGNEWQPVQRRWQCHAPYPGPYTPAACATRQDMMGHPEDYGCGWRLIVEIPE